MEAIEHRPTRFEKVTDYVFERPWLRKTTAYGLSAVIGLPLIYLTLTGIAKMKYGEERRQEAISENRQLSMRAIQKAAGEDGTLSFDEKIGLARASGCVDVIDGADKEFSIDITYEGELAVRHKPYPFDNSPSAHHATREQLKKYLGE